MQVYRLMLVLTFSAVAIIASAAVTALPADASCNAVPDALQISGMTDSGKNIKKQLPEDLPYRGDFGRVNRAMLVPGVTASIVMGPDLGCAERLLVATDGSREASPEDVIGIALFHDQVTGPEFAIYATPEVRGRVERVFRQQSGKDASSLSINWQSDKLEVRQERGPLGRDTYRVRFGYPEASPSRRQHAKDMRVLSGPMTVALVGATEQGVANVAELAQKLRAGGCERVREDFEKVHDGYVCAGTIYDDFAVVPEDGGRRAASALHPRCNLSILVQDPIPCEITALSALELDFGKQCQSSKLTGLQMSACGNKPSKLGFDVDHCGGVHFPISWKNILAPGFGIGGKRRIVSGVSGVSRERYPKKGGRIIVPGREFVGSTHPLDVNGKVGDWRKPDIEVIQPGKNQLVGLKGSVDQLNSVVHVYPRLATSHHCKFAGGTPPSGPPFTEACLGVEQMEKGGTEKCACDDRVGMSCQCLVLGPAKYYACSGGSLAGMPCTRPIHCNLASNPGHCDGTPTCRRIGDVWKKGKKHSQKTGLGNYPCETDAECKGKKDNAGYLTPQCGYSLFEFRDPPKYAPHVVTLDYGLSFNAGIPPQRGTCSGDHTRACTKSSINFWQCWFAGSCTGYALHAGGTK